MSSTLLKSLSSGMRSRSSSTRDDGPDDEEAAMWAALERLPTYSRIRTTILEKLKGSRKERTEVDVKDVDHAQYLASQVFKLNNPHEDNEKFLSKLRSRIDRAGVEIPTVEVRYKDLTVTGKVHVGGRALPTLANTLADFFDAILKTLKIVPDRKSDLIILDGVSGIIKPGRLALLLGPPSGGKSTFLTTLAGQVDKTLEVQGTVSYNGHTFKEFEPRKSAAYITQNDDHAPTLTVKETMDYSARYQGVGSRYDIISELLTKEKEMGIRPDLDTDVFMKASAVEDVSHHIVTDYYIKIMGLDICENTIVGDQMIKGISGGQRKRLTTGEMIVGPARVLFMDEISTGLDSSTTYQVVKCIGQFASISKQTVLMSLLQPAPETYNLFDDVILLSGGEVVYHGPREDILDFFESCGFKCPPRKGVADYLQEVTSLRDQEQYWIEKSKPYTFVAAKEFAEKFRTFHVGQRLFQDLEIPFDKSMSHKSALVYKKWSLSAFDLFKITLDKELLLLKKDPVFIFLMIMEFFVGGIIASVFFRTTMHHKNLHDAQKYAGALFILTTQAVFSGYQELAVTTGRYPVFSKFRQSEFFPPWAWSTALLIIKIPSAILEAFFLMSVNYYIIGFAPAPARFFKQWLLLSVGDLMSACLFRSVACICRSLYLGSSVGGFGMLILFTLGGFVISRKDIRGWWIWGYYISPVSYVMNAVMVNEYFAKRWKHHLPGDSHSVGQTFILSKGLFARGYWYWLGLGAVFLSALILQATFTIVITYLGPPAKSRAVVSKELMAEWRAALTGEVDKSVISLPRSISTGLESGSASVRRSRRKSLAEDGNKNGNAGEGGGSASSQALQRAPSTASGVEMSKFSYSTNRRLSSKSAGESSLNSFGENRGMVLPFQPFSISFKDISYAVDMPAGQRKQGVTEDKLQLLRKITGAFRPGVLTALVGVTGAGKSTLMDVLSGRKTRGYVEGEIRINGYPKVQETFTRIAGYCEQNDVHSPQITVNESVLFSAWLRLQPEVTSQIKKDFAKLVLDLVELTALRDALVGVPGQSGLSPEQRKRLTIAVELVANPSIIFMDEPTSGLDARAAATVMRAVRNTVDTGRTVVCTIHQPSIDIFETFDELLLLKRGGQAIYAGPLGHNSCILVDYFQNMADVPKIQEGENPAAWMLEISTPGMEQKLGVDFAELFEKSDAAKQTRELVEKLSIAPANTEDISFPTRFAQPLWAQFTCCLWKQYWTYWRSPGYNFMRFFLCVAASSFMGSVFWAFAHKMTTEQRLYSLMGSIYASTAFYGLLTCGGIQPVIAAERTVFYRERGAGMYSEISYALAQCLIEVPFVFVASSVYVAIEYSMIKLEWKASKFLLYWFLTFNSQLTFVFWGMLTIALTSSPGAAVLLVTIGNQMWALFSGFPITRKDMPVWWRWAYWCNPSAYSLYGKIASQFGDYSHKYVLTRAGSLVSVKQLIQDRYGFKHSHLGFVTTMTAMFPAVFAVGFILAITYLNYQQR